MAEVAGWLHDLGKFRPPFQQYLQGLWKGPEKEKRHAVFGAAAAAVQAKVPSVAFAILGHHAGLHDYEGELKPSLRDRDLKPLEAAPALLKALEAAMGGVPIPWHAPIADPILRLDPKSPELSAPLDLELRARMLFSCLVDADRLDTERYFTGAEREPNPLDAATLADRLSEHLAYIVDQAPETPVNAARRSVLAACRRMAAEPPGIFSLTAPTGSGKTLAAMAFALEHAKIHAKKHGLRRVIVVLPFLAIIEQNAQVYRKALERDGERGVVLEHHSALVVEEGDEAEGPPGPGSRGRRATENWDAPVVVTTAVQFLESLFSRRPGRCRKLHNIARSVVVFDEVQTLPFPLLDPILGALQDLSTHFGVTALLCSATRPKFSKIDKTLPSGFGPDRCREVIDDRATTFETLARARLELPFLAEGRWSWGDLAARLEATPKALVIVNLRKHAQQVYDLLKDRKFANLHHLSSTMCPAHREAVLGRKDHPAPGTIHAHLATDHCILISTQVVEAGVDIDFPVVYRALSPLDAIIQAAGRCDREGLLTLAAGSPAGRVIVFEPAAEPSTPPGYYQRATAVARDFLEEHAADPSRILVDPAIFERFHQRLIAKGEGRELGKCIQDQRRSLNFRTVDGLFKIIDEAGRGVVVPFGEGADLIRAIPAQGHLEPEDRRKLQRFTVSLMPDWIEHFRHLEQIRPLLAGQEDGPLEYVGKYDDVIGIRIIELPPESFCLTGPGSNPFGDVS